MNRQYRHATSRTARLALALTFVLLCVAALSQVAHSDKGSKQQRHTVVVRGIQDAGNFPSDGVALDLPPGAYRVSYVRGCYLDCPGSCWRADVSCTFTSGTTLLPLGNGQPPPGTGFASPGECETASRGGHVEASHAGGPAYFWIRDVDTSNNTNDSITIRISRIP